MPAVDIVMPLFRSARWMEAAVESVLAQKGVEWSLICVDDGSPDESGLIATQLAQRDARVSVVRQDNRGACNARNRGAAASAGRYLVFLDADDQLLPGALAALAGHLDTYPSLAVYGEVVGIDAHGSPTVLPSWPRRIRATRLWLAEVAPAEPTPPEAFVGGSFALPSAFMVRRAAFEGAGGWDEDLGQFYEDSDLWARVSLAGPVTPVSVPVAAYRIHADQFSADPEKEGAQRHSLLEKWRQGSARQRRVANIIDHRVVPRSRLAEAVTRGRQGEIVAASRCMLGAARTYRLWL